MLNEDHEEKSIQSFRIPLEIVGDESRNDQHHYSSTSTYGGDLLLSVTYQRSILKVNIFLKLIRSMSELDLNSSQINRRELLIVHLLIILKYASRLICCVLVV